jgi:hypothetical protein
MADSRPARGRFRSTPYLCLPVTFTRRAGTIEFLRMNIFAPSGPLRCQSLEFGEVTIMSSSNRDVDSNFWAIRSRFVSGSVGRVKSGPKLFATQAGRGGTIRCCLATHSQLRTGLDTILSRAPVCRVSWPRRHSRRSAGRASTGRPARTFWRAARTSLYSTLPSASPSSSAAASSGSASRPRPATPQSMTSPLRSAAAVGCHSLPIRAPARGGECPARVVAFTLQSQPGAA